MEFNIEKSIQHIWPSLTVEQKIGSGASGEVFRVRREGMGRSYYSAVKVIQIPKDTAEIMELKNDGIDDHSMHGYYREMVRQMSGEIDLMESLKSAPNIVTIEDFCVRKRRDRFGWIAYIRMELLENLNTWLERKGLVEEDVLHLGIDLCTALEYCEKLGVIHRDIKPANVFVTEFGDFKLGDFGISRKSWLSGVRSTKGTYAYMAPEVARGENYDKTVDYYSLGIMMYRLLNENRLPFMPPAPAVIRYEDNQISLSRRLGGEPLPPPAHGHPLLVEAILKTCAFRSFDRFQSAEELKEVLLRCRGLSGECAPTQLIGPFENNPVTHGSTLSGEPGKGMLHEHIPGRKDLPRGTADVEPDTGSNNSGHGASIGFEPASDISGSSSSPKPVDLFMPAGDL